MQNDINTGWFEQIFQIPQGEGYMYKYRYYNTYAHECCDMTSNVLLKY